MKETRKDNGVVGIVTSILLVGLLVTVFSIVQTVYVPQWMEENERDHMDVVAAQFAELKHTIDIQLYEPSYYNIPISTPITLGSEKIPYFLSKESSGSIEIQEGNIELTIHGNTTTSYSLGSIKYSSQNSYFQDQTYIYEAGTVILYQTQGTLLVSKPFFSVSNDEDIDINLTIVDIVSIGGKTSSYGSNTCLILTNYSSTQSTVFQNISDITITTSYIKPWKEYINSTLTNQGLTQGSDYDIDETSSSITLDFQSSIKNVHISIRKITMNAQLAPGWIS